MTKHSPMGWLSARRARLGLAATLVAAALFGGGTGIWLAVRHAATPVQEGSSQIPSLSPIPPPRGTIYTVSGSIPSDGSVDVTAALNRVLDDVPSGTQGHPSIVQFQRGGRYRVEGTVVVQDKRYFVLDGNGATLFATTIGSGTYGQIQNRIHLKVRLGSHITVQNLRIQGPHTKPGYNPAYCCQTGIAIQGTDTAMVQNNTILNTWGDGVSVDLGPITPPTPVVFPRHITVQNNLQKNDGRQAMSVIGGDDIWFVGNTLFPGTGMTVFDLEADTRREFITNVHILNNRVDYSLLAPKRGALFISAAGAASVSYVEVRGNRSSNGPLFITARGPFSTDRSHDWTIANNIGAWPRTCSAYGYYVFRRVRNVRLDSNVQPVCSLNSQSVVVIAADAHSLHVTNNAFANGNPILSCDHASTDCTESGKNA